MVPMRKPLPEDLCLWPDGTLCFFCDLEQYSWMSDDFEIIGQEDARYNEVLAPNIEELTW